MACAGGGGGQPDVGQPDAVEAWTSSFTPGVEKRGQFLVVRLKGTPYEMGVQHATFLREQLLEGVQYIEGSELGLLEQVADQWGFTEEAMAQSYPAVADECRGMADVLADKGWTFKRCILLAYGDVILEWVKSGKLSESACSQFVVTRGATADRGMLHGRNLDWDRIEFMVKYPTLLVRHPADRIPYVVVGFPGCVAPYSGMNAAGLSGATNEADSRDDIDRVGRSHPQMLSEVLSTARSLAEAKALIAAADHMTATIMVLADGRSDEAAVFEMTANHRSVRELSKDGVVFATNHFIGEETAPHGYVSSPTASTYSRFERLSELLSPASPLYGTLDPASAVGILRDHHNPLTGEDAPPDAFDNYGTIANNGCIYSIVFAPKQRVMWVAAGEPPVPLHKYVGFSLDELLGLPGAKAPEPAELP